MNRRRFLAFALALPLLCGACLFRHHKSAEKQPQGPKLYNVVGTVKRVSATSLTIENREGMQTFVITASTVRGSDFKPDMTVHVYFYREQNQDIAKMVVERVR